MSCLKSIKSHDSLQTPFTDLWFCTRYLPNFIFKSSCITLMFEGLNICQGDAYFFSLSPFRQESVLMYFLPTVAPKCNSVCLTGSHVKNYRKKIVNNYR